MKPTLETAVAQFGVRAAQKLSNPAASGAPEDQLRAPFEHLLQELAALCHLAPGAVIAVGETRLGALQTRPDYAVTVHGALVGHIEIKAPGKGADPRRFKDAHDRSQWTKLASLPNLVYTDGNAFSLWRGGELQGAVVRLDGDVETSGAALAPGSGLHALFQDFLLWEPQAPRSARELAKVSARLCRLLRDEVAEQLAAKSEALTGLATDWRKLLFPEANDQTFADGYAQAVTFGLLMARAQDISLANGFHTVANALGSTSSLIGAALHLLTDNAAHLATLKTSLETLRRVLDVVDWNRLSKGDADAWLYFYEDFLDVYDHRLRKQTGSYYTPPQVVNAMVRWVDEALRGPRYGLHAGLASADVTLVDPATGTGTYLLGVLRHVAARVKQDEGEGAVAGAVQAAVSRLIAFEMQLGPYAVAQLRLLAEIVDLSGSAPARPLPLYVTDTLGSPHDSAEHIFQLLKPLAESRLAANRIKRDTPVTVVIGNPPYKEKAKGKGGWVESGDPARSEHPPLKAWMPPAAWKAGAHSKHLRNLYVYFWRWASWKVWDHGPGAKNGMVCFITVAGFLGGPGFQQMRAWLRERCDEIWVLDCTPEGHQPAVGTRIFQGVQQPVCIVLASRSAKKRPGEPARVRFRALPDGARREDKFAALGQIGLHDAGWTDCPDEPRAPFLPASTGAWAAYPKLEDLFAYNGGGVQPKRTWVIAPDAESLSSRWKALLHEPDVERKQLLFHPTLRGGKPADRHIHSVVSEELPGYPVNPTPLASESQACPPPIRYGFRSFNRQWIIPDPRVITQPNAALWESRSESQVYLTAFTEESPSSGPALTFTGLVPDLHHYKGSFGGRAFPLWSDAAATRPNLAPGLLAHLSHGYGAPVSAEDVVAYIAAVAAHPAYTARFQDDLSTPGLRIPLTADAARFRQAAAIGRRVIWLHCFGERMCDAADGRPAQPPRLPPEQRPQIPKEGSIPPQPLPDEISYDPATRRLRVGAGFVAHVAPEVWAYEVSGKPVLAQWFSYRRRDRSRPQIGDKRPPSPLVEIQPETWLAEYTTELLNVINVLGLLVQLEPQQAALLDAICAGPLIAAGELPVASAPATTSAPVARGLFD